MTETPEDGRKAKDLIEWLGFAPVPDWSKSRALGAIFGVLLCLFFLVSIPFAAVAVPAIIFGTIRDVLNGSTSGPNLGAGALITALLGAPFLIWSTVIKHKSLGFQKEGHLTDRISKAVEQLGAEKKVDRIGRSKTIWSGTTRSWTHLVSIRANFELPPRSVIVREYHGASDTPDDEFVGLHIEIKQWSDEITIIEKQDEPYRLPDGSHVGIEGEWKVFSETLPNIEVRIGGILSLERIAQDSTAYDKGRDHVRCMEILCAYVRENSPSKNLLANYGSSDAKIPRIDIQTTINVVKRRSDRQRQIEATALYRLDLRSTDLDRCDLSSGSFAGALLSRSRLEAANLDQCDLSGARMQGCLLNNASFWKAIMRGTILDHCVISHQRAPLAINFTSGKSLCVSAVGADLSGVSYLGEYAKNIFGSSDTKLSEFAEEAREEIHELIAKKLVATRTNDEAGVAKLEREISAHPMADWCQYPSNDMALNFARRKFYEVHELSGWPFID